VHWLKLTRQLMCNVRRKRVNDTSTGSKDVLMQRVLLNSGQWGEGVE
jgi:hypothetical protein